MAMENRDLVQKRFFNIGLTPSQVPFASITSVLP